MKKQVTFAQSRNEHKLQKHRFSLPTESKSVFKDADVSEQRLYRRFSTPGDHSAMVHIPRSMATAPFLKHSGLTPAQREYLYSVASSSSGERVRDIISTHYMNILHRCIRAGHTGEKQYILAPVPPPQTVRHGQTDVAARNEPTTSKRKGKSSAGAKDDGKTALPKINKRPPRRLKTPVSKQRKKLATPPKLTPKSPSVSARALSPDDDDLDDDLDEDWLKDWEDEGVKGRSEWREAEPSLEGRSEWREAESSLKDELSSLSLTDWDSLSDSDS